MNNKRPAPCCNARVYGSPGTRVRLLGLARSLWPMILILVAFGYLLRAAAPVPALSSTTTGLLFLALAALLAAAANRCRDRLTSYLKGARGEETVARLLATLPEGWHIFHGIATPSSRFQPSQGGADIDHVVVAPGCVFVIETKNWSGTISIESGTLLCDGVPPDRDPIQQVMQASLPMSTRILAEHMQASTHVPVASKNLISTDIPLVPVLCFNGSLFDDTVKDVGDVAICQAEDLCAILVRHASGRPPIKGLDGIILALTGMVDKEASDA